MSGIDRDVWLKALATAGIDDGEDDQGAVTVLEFAEAMSMNRYTAGRKLESLVEKGCATRTKKWYRTSYGRRLHMTAYRLTEPARKAKR